MNEEVKIDPNGDYYFAFNLENSSSLVIKDIYEVAEYHHHDWDWGIGMKEKDQNF